MNKPAAGDMMICQRSMSPNILLVLLLLRASNILFLTFSRSTGFGCYVRDYWGIRKTTRQQCAVCLRLDLSSSCFIWRQTGSSNCECAIAGLRETGRAGVCCHFWLNDLSERTTNRTANECNRQQCEKRATIGNHMVPVLCVIVVRVHAAQGPCRARCCRCCSQTFHSAFTAFPVVLSSPSFIRIGFDSRSSSRAGIRIRNQIVSHHIWPFGQCYFIICLWWI